MIIECPGCMSRVDVNDVPTRASYRDEAWMCLACPAIVCLDCYGTHTKAKHPMMGVKKRKK